MADSRFPKYFIVIMAIYAAVFLLTLFELSSVIGDAALLLLLMLVPAILLGVYAFRYPKSWFRLLISVLAAIAIVFSLAFILPVL